MAARRSWPARSLLLFVACSALVPPASLGYELTAANVRAAVGVIKQLVESVDGPAAAGTSYKLFVAGFIRLAFHSCVGDKCVGCLNVDDPSNNGLNASVAALERARSTLADGANAFNITRGDLWALAAKVAFQVGVARAGGASRDEADPVRFRYGREDCATAPYTRAMEAFPDKRWGIDAALRYFGDRGFSAREVAALMGFHTLGVVRDGPNKVVGQWVATPDLINNQFYRDLADKNWTQRATDFNGTGQTQTVYTWARSDSASMIMINTDVAILKNFTVADSVTGRSVCTVASECPASQTGSDAEQFAGNVTMWRVEAAHALTKLIERGYSGSSGLKEPTPDPETTTATAAATTASGGGSSAARWSALTLLCALAMATLAANSRCRD